MNREETAADPAAHGVGRDQLHQGLADVDAEHVGAAQHRQRGHRQPQRLFERPKTTVAAPKTATAAEHHAPGWLAAAGGEVAARPAPRRWRPGARMPKPCGPTCSTSRANTGSSAVAPPSSTAKRSSEMAPKTILLPQ